MSGAAPVAGRQDKRDARGCSRHTAGPAGAAEDRVVPLSARGRQGCGFTRSPEERPFLGLAGQPDSHRAAVRGAAVALSPRRPWKPPRCAEQNSCVVSFGTGTGLEGPVTAADRLNE